MEVKLRKPIQFDEEEVKVITLDLDGLRGSDITDAYRQYSAAGNFSAVVSTDPNFCKHIAAAASSKPLEFFDQLGAADFMHVHQTVQNFLLSSGLDDQTSTAKYGNTASSSAKGQKQA